MTNPLLMLHGFGQSGALWTDVSEHLPGEALSVPDLRGHGEKSDVRPIGIDECVGDVIELARGLEAPILVGYSMGGRLALRSVLRSPEAFTGLVLISTSAGIESSTERERRREADERLARLLEDGRLDEFESIWTSAAVWTGDPEATAERSLELRRANSGPALAEALRRMGSGTIPDVWKSLPSISLPTLILHGSRDRAYAANAARMAALIPNSSVEAIAGAGHSLPIEEPAATAGAIRAFSRRLPPVGPGSPHQQE